LIILIALINLLIFSSHRLMVVRHKSSKCSLLHLRLHPNQLPYRSTPRWCHQTAKYKTFL